MMIMKKRILLACYISALSICLSESSTQKGLGEMKALIQEYVDDLANQDDGLRIASYEEEPRLLLGGLHQRGKREQGSAGLWGRKRQQPTMWEEQNHKEDRMKKSKENERREKRTDSSSSEQKFGSAGLWGKRESDDLWEEREMKKPPDTGLWGKRATKGSSRLGRKASKLKEPQGNIGLWNGKRGEKAFIPHNEGEDFGKRIRQTGNTGLWGRNPSAKKSGRRRFSGGRKKTVYWR